MGLLSPSSEFETTTERAIERRSTVIFRVGSAIYVVSLFLVAVKEPSGTPVLGFLCAIGTLNLQVAFVDALLRHTLGSWPAVEFAMIPSGWTNILVPITIWNQWMRPGTRTTSMLCLFTVATIPSSWLTIANLQLRVREGHVMWLIGIGLMLGCQSLAERTSRLAIGGRSAAL